MTAIGTVSFAGVGLDNGVGVLDGRIFGAVLRLDIFEHQLDLVVTDALRAATELGAAKNRDDMIEAFGTRGQAALETRIKEIYAI